MKKINFTKMVASGNDFVVIPENKLSRDRISLSAFAKVICDRKFGAGADGLLLAGHSSKADMKMRIFNADGSEAEMCGNGARCMALWGKLNNKKIKGQAVTLQTKAGIIESRVGRDVIKIKLTPPQGARLDIPLKVNGRGMKVNFINTGVPHVVVFVEGLEKVSVAGIGRILRYHDEFAPRGTNVNFIEPLTGNSFKIRTYERGVEDETLACGTGTVASSLIFALKGGSGNKIEALTRGGERLKVYFVRTKSGFNDVWLEGRARVVYQGEYYV